MFCENCKNPNDGKYASGRFCSSGCSRGFSTKDKRDLINKKISLSLKKSEFLLKICEFCKLEFECNRNSRRKTCSKKCSNDIQKGRSKKGNYSKNGGFREGGGRSKVFQYTNHLGRSMKLNLEEIEVSKILDSLKLDWDRNWKFFRYLDEDVKERKFYPDFYIKDLNLFVEYKGWITDKMRNKMRNSLLLNNFNLLIVVGKDPRVSKDGLCIDKLEDYLNVIQTRRRSDLQNLDG